MKTASAQKSSPAAPMTDIGQATTPKIPVGYKMTELGMIPNDWKVKQLSDCSRICSGGTPSTNIPQYWDGNISWCTPTDITKLSGKKYITYTERKISEQGLKSSSAELLPSMSVIMTSRATIGECAINISSISTNQGFKNFIPFTETDSHFLYYLLSQQKQRFIALCSGSTFLEIGKKQLDDFKVIFPSFPEQKAIAGALSDIDDLIAAQEELITKKRDIKQATMQQLLTGRTRLPGFKKKWDNKRIGDITDCISGGTPNTQNSSYWNGNIKWMSSGELHHKFVFDVAGRITQAGLESSSTRLIPEKCVLIGLAGQGKTRGTAALNLIELCTNQSIAAILPNDNFVPEFLYYNLDTRYDELRSLSTGDGGRGGLNLTIIKSIEVNFPPIEEQEAIASVLSDMDAEISALEAELEKTRAVKQGMMQELLTGRIRLI